MGANGVALDQQIATLQALVDSQRGALEAVSQDAETELAALRETITNEVARLQASSAIVRLTLAMESGAPFVAALVMLDWLAARLAMALGKEWLEPRHLRLRQPEKVVHCSVCLRRPNHAASE